MSFVQKNVNATGHFGADLLDLRERAGWTRAFVSGRLKLTESFIRALEEEDWSSISDPIYAERILRAYVDFLGGNQRYFLDKYRECLKQDAQARAPSEYLPRTRQIRLFDLTDATRVTAVLGFVLFVMGLGGYVYAQARAISAPPPLTLDEPDDGARVSEPFVLVKGKTLPESSVLINGRQAVVQADGSFALTMEVPRGVTTILVTAKKRHGREADLTRRVMYDRALPGFLDDATSTSSMQP